MAAIAFSKIGSVIIEKICKDYISGFSIHEINKLRNISTSSVYRILKANNINTSRNNSNNRYRNKLLKYSINEDYFEFIDTQEKAYILGFLYADGNMHSKLRHVNLKLQERDKDILIKINTLIGSNKPIYFGKKVLASHRNNVKIVISNKKIYGDLLNKGLHPNKTFKLEFPYFLNSDLIPHFIRGYFDGDGCISIYDVYEKYNLKRVKLIKVYKKLKIEFSIMGTMSLCRSVQDIFKSIGVLGSISNDKRSDIRVVRFKVWRHIYIDKIYRYLYTDSVIHLNRKRKTFIRFINQISK
jgi:hypothetical protein